MGTSDFAFVLCVKLEKPRRPRISDCLLRLPAPDTGWRLAQLLDLPTAPPLPGIPATRTGPTQR